MKNLKNVLTLLLVFALTVTTSLIYTPSAMAKETTNSVNLSTEAVSTTSQKYAEAMAPGWNLGNSFDSFDTNGDNGEESWGNPAVTKELIDKVKDQGFKSIRIPLTTVMRTGEAPDYTIDSKFLARYAEVVNWALDDGLYVVINIHHDSWSWANAIGSDSDDGASLEKYEAIWTQLADYFKDYSDKVCFESLNEPQFTTGDTANQIKILEEVNTAFYNIVRKSGGDNGTRMLVLPTLNTNDSDDRCESLYNMIEGFNDPNIMATFHYYGYWPFSVNIAGTTTMDETVVTSLDEAFDRIYDHFTSKGIGVICGEYGLLGFDSGLDSVEHGEVLKYFEYINYYAQKKGITLMLWDNGQHLGRTSLEWSDESLYNMMKTSWTSRSSYSDSDRIFITDANKSNDVSTKLTLNGNTLESIYNGSNKLTLGTDYTCSDDTVTLKGSYINNVITSDYGTNATLTMKFSAGADWDVYLDHYATPELSIASGSSSGFVIPVKFNGSKLSTLEAVYSDGSGAGPQNWTTYKQFNSDFSADYEANTVTIEDNFFSQANDGYITFKLHFQSGEVLHYVVKKSDTVVSSVSYQGTDY